MPTIDPDAIGISYQIDLTKLAESIRRAKGQLAAFHKDLAGLAKKASVKITVNDQAANAAKAKVQRFANAIQATLDKTGSLKIKETSKSFGAIGGKTDRMIADYEKLNKVIGRSPKLLGGMDSAFKKVNNSVQAQAVRMQAAGKNGLKYYETANRVNLTLQVLKGTLKTTATGFKNVALETRRAAEASKKATQARIAEKEQLKQTAAAAKQAATAEKSLASASATASVRLKTMGITSQTTAAQIKAMKLSALDTARVLTQTRSRMKELSDQTAKSGRATKGATQEYKRLQERLPALEHEANKGVKAFGDYRRAMDRWGQGFKFMMLSQAAWIASGAVLFGTLSAITGAIRGFIDFHQDLRDAAAIVQATTTGYEKMEKAAVKAFLNSTMSLKDTTEALKILGQTGMEAADAAIALETVYKITTATGGDTTSVVKFLTTAINVWKLSAEEAARVGNVLGAALNYSKLEVEDLGTTFNYVASLAKSLGLTIEDLAAIMAVMSNAGIKASTIGTGLRGVFTKLLAPTNKFETQLKTVGLTIADVSLETNNFFDVLKRLETAGFDIGKVFRGITRREAASLNVILEQGVERFNLMREALIDTTAVEVMFERSMRGMKNQIVLAGHAMQQYLIDRLNNLKPIITGVAIFIRELITTMGELNGIFVIAAVGLLAWKLNMLAATTATITFTSALAVLKGALLFLGGHQIIAVLVGLGLLIGAITTFKIVTDKLNDSLDEQRSRLNKRIDDLRKLRILMLDSNRTDEEKLQILRDYAKDYPEFLDLLEQHKTNAENVVSVTTKMIQADMKHKRVIDIKRLAVIEADEAMLASRKRMLEKAAKDDPMWGAGLLKETKNIEKEIMGLQNAARLLRDELGLPVKGDLMVDFPEVGDEADKTTVFKWTKEQERELERLRKAARTAREQAGVELEKGFAQFRFIKGMEKKEWREALEGQVRTQAEYNKKIAEIKEREQKDRDKITKKITDRIEKERKERDRIIGREIKDRLKAMSSFERAVGSLRKITATDRGRALIEFKDEIDKLEELGARANKSREEIDSAILMAENKKNQKLKEIRDREQNEKDKTWDKEFKNILKAEKKREDALDREIDILVKAGEKRKKEFEGVVKTEQSLLNALDAFKRKLKDDEGRLIEDEYERKRFILNKEIEDRQRMYSKMLAEAIKFYNELKEQETTNTLLKGKKEEVAKFITAIKALQAELDKLAGREKTKLKTEQTDKELADQYKKWEDMTKDTASAMHDSFSDLFFDAMKGELKSLGDYWKAFGNAVKRQIADIAASGITSGLFGKKGEGTGLLGTILGAAGNIFGASSTTSTATTTIPTSHSGGPSGGGLTLMKEKEFVIRDSSARSIGLDALNFMNKTGRVPTAAPSVTNVHHSYTIVAMDSESMDQALRRGGAKAIQDISIGSYMYEKERNPRFGR